MVRGNWRLAVALTMGFISVACVTPLDSGGEISQFDTRPSPDTLAADSSVDVADNDSSASDSTTSDSTTSDSTTSDTAAVDTAPIVDSCAALTCDDPPRPRCDADGAVIAFASVGTCTNGVCDYPAATAACESPPELVCADDKTLRSFAPAGTCADGVCRYEAIDALCDVPPTPTCADATTVRQFDAEGACLDGACSYMASDLACDTPPPATCLGASQLQTWDALGACTAGECSYVSALTDCGEPGCCGDHCCVVRPANGNVVGDLVATGLTLGPPNGVFDTTSDCVSGSSFGDCAIESAASSPDLCVCRADNIVVGDIQLVGAHGLALLASETIVVSGVFDASATEQASGGGFSFEHPDQPSSAGAGGHHNGTGGGASGDSSYGLQSLEPLWGGMRGQDAGCDASGGGGGGALQLSAGRTISISGTIDVSGGGGERGPSEGCRHGAGGGSGGAVLIEAPVVTVLGDIVANGGGGGGAAGGCNNWSSGQDGTDGDVSGGGEGGQSNDGDGCFLDGNTSGGDGGDGGDSSSAAESGQAADSVGCVFGCQVGAGGGGGAPGRVRINTKLGSQGCVCSGNFSPGVTFGDITLE